MPQSSNGFFEEEDDGYDEEGEAALAELEHEEEGRPVAPLANAAEIADDDLPPPILGKCIDCNDAEGQKKFFEAFGLSVCYQCQQLAKGAGGKYQVITKSKAKDEYLLTDRQLDRAQGGLGCMTRPNPHDSRYGDMRLYLRSQAERLALKAWGSDEALFVEKERRSKERLERAGARKRKKEEKLSTTAKRAAAAPKRSSTADAALDRAVNSYHEHVYLPDETYDEATDKWTKRCACGHTVTYEVF